MAADAKEMPSVDGLKGKRPSTAGLAGARKRLPRWVVTAVSVIMLLALWEGVGRHINPILGAPPSAIAVACWKLMVSGKLWPALLSSLESFFSGFVLAILIGVPLGLFIGSSRYLEAAIGVYVTAGYAAPMVAFVPLLVLWFGLGFTVKVIVVFMMAVFPVCINTWLGVRVVPKSLVEVGQAFVAPKRVILRRIILPATIPHIMAGIKLSGGRAVVGIVIAEFFTSISGLGGIIINSANNFQTARMFVPIVLLMLLAVFINGLISFLEKKVAPWQSELGGGRQEES